MLYHGKNEINEEFDRTTRRMVKDHPIIVGVLLAILGAPWSHFHGSTWGAAVGTSVPYGIFVAAGLSVLNRANVRQLRQIRAEYNKGVRS